MPDFIIKKDISCDGLYTNKETGFSTGYYTVKEIENMYPNGRIRVVGQLKYGDKEVGEIEADGIGEPVYKAVSSKRYKTIGYIELENDDFIAVKKDNLLMLLLWLLLGLLILAGIIFGIVYGVKRANADVPPTTTTPNLLDENAQQGIGQLELPSKLDTSDKRVTVTGITAIKFKAGQTKQNTVFMNSEKNKDICFMRFFLYLDNNGNGKIDDSDELLYESNLVQPGYAISNIDIKRPLESGEYKAIVRTQPYSYDQQRVELNRMDTATVITVTQS